ncbi:NAD-dependent protein deacetylase sirtuin-2 [Onthophagus taurus]|uniref:NAD-dependent protein deacetylase sirtuin-2 n=1 Tax=Onthophagus taurus TaxID=166361 RepID=UPI000C2054E8|nr:NAD-dependent protein deacetylase sirtuin-2 isoform X2 [Onthophagus taurus]
MSSEEKDGSKSHLDDDSEEETPGTSEATGMGYIRKYLASKLGLSDDDEESSKNKVLSEFTLDGIVEYIKSDKCKKIITMAGAGISTSAGIPDFRSPVYGLYHNLQKYNLPHPQAIFELDFFHKNPRPFFELAKELYPGTFKPTVCHYFIKMLNNKGILLRHYTQNIDTLERVAGIPDEKLVEAHGTFNQGHCLECNKEYSQEWMKDKIFTIDVPICEDCPGVVKPDIVFFGESLPEKFYRYLQTDFVKADLLIILGSSLAVQPFASLVDRVSKECPRLLINREKAGQRSGLMAIMGVGGGLEFDSSKNTRDVCWLGDCDDGCLLLAEKLGWKEELLALYDQELSENDKEDGEKKEDEKRELDRNKREEEIKEDDNKKSIGGENSNKL